MSMVDNTLPASAVLGAQWGDEGKGKAIDQLATFSDWAVRFQGGNNAGHTIVVGDTTLKLHLLPSGITNKECKLVLGCGMVIDPWVLDKELDGWYSIAKERPEGDRLFISDRASVIFPFHRFYDEADKIIGTTGRGIGPTYRDRTERVGIRFADLKFLLNDKNRLVETTERMNKQLNAVGVKKEISSDELFSDISWILERFSNSIRNTGTMLHSALEDGDQILLEGAQGSMLDIDQGTYPFVTSSITGRANASHGSGIHPGQISSCYGISKAYTTRVGNGPFPTELSLEEGPGKQMSKLGNEFGTTTGRPRRTGWLDLVALKESQRINGYSGLVITKLDVLGGLDEILYCVSYSLDGKEIDFLPTATEDLSRCKPIYHSLPGFQSMTGEEWISLANKSRKEKGIEILPNSIRNYLKVIEDFVGVPVICVGVGPDRMASIARLNGPFDFEIPEATF